MTQTFKSGVRVFTLTLAMFWAACAALAEDKDHGDHGMTMHHMHIMLNHAIETAAKGSNLIMIGEMGMAKGIDEVSIAEGKAMIANARSVIEKMMKGKTMEHMHMEGVTGTNAMMHHTHELGDAALKYIDLLDGMSTAGHKHEH
ncbi:MAG: hypothetical protein MJH08_08040 [Hyphomicrobiales bacterium]|nr:hypothetical protein [Hyphomicrobiales bacterium]